MAGVDGATSAQQTNQAAAALNGARQDSLLGDTQDRFLTLLVTQLRNQDPLNPMDNAEVTSQIAQLSTVNGIQQLNNTLLALSGQMDMSQSLQAANLIGKNVLYPGDLIKVGDDPQNPGTRVTTPYGIDLMSPAAQVTVTIFDGSGRAVRTQELGAQPAGVYGYVWDGRDDAGAAAPGSAFHVQVRASDDKGQPVSVNALTHGQVDSVGYGANGLELNLGAGDKISLLDVRQVM